MMSKRRDILTSQTPGICMTTRLIHFVTYVDIFGKRAVITSLTDVKI